MRAEIAAIPDGVYEFSDVMEDDGVVAEPVTFHVTVTVDGDRLIVDWTGTVAPGARTDQRDVRRHLGRHLQRDLPRHGREHPEELGRLPADPASSRRRGRSRTSSTRARRSAATPRRTRSSPTWSSGRSRRRCPIGWRRPRAAPRATSCSAASTRRPATTTRTTTSRAAAGAPSPTTTATTRSSSRTATAGTRRSRSSRRATRCARSSTRSSPTRAARAGCAAASGRGAHARQEGAEVTANALFDRTKPGFGAWGLDGGGKGGRGAIMVKRRGDAEFRTFSEVYGTVSPSKFTNIRLEPGDEVLIDSPGGGGYGDRASSATASASSVTSTRASSPSRRPASSTAGTG